MFCYVKTATLQASTIASRQSWRWTAVVLNCVPGLKNRLDMNGAHTRWIWTPAADRGRSVSLQSEQQTASLLEISAEHAVPEHIKTCFVVHYRLFVTEFIKAKLNRCKELQNKKVLKSSNLLANTNIDIDIYKNNCKYHLYYSINDIVIH